MSANDPPGNGLETSADDDVISELALAGPDCGETGSVSLDAAETGMVSFDQNKNRT